MQPRIAFVAVTGAVLFAAATTVLSQDKKAPPQEGMDFHSAPGPAHKQLQKRVGEYTTTMKFTDRKSVV